jgi:leucyl-tRNA synthetase
MGAEYEIDYSTPIAVDDSELPLQLPEMEDYRPGNDPRGPLAKALEWRFFQKEGQWYARETNTMPQWAGSCWYYLRFLDPGNTARLISEQAYDDWMPVDLYVGGSEHAVLHLLYARFWHKVLFDIGVVRHPEPFTKLVHQGLILGMSYRWYAVVGSDGNIVRALDGDDPRVTKGEADGLLRLSDTNELVEPRWINEDAVTVRDGTPTHHELGVRVVGIAEKMSKSRGNVVNPDTVVNEFGADSLRLYEMFMGPLEQPKPWQTSGLQGVRRFLDRVYALGTRELSEDPMDEKTARMVHRMVKKVGEDIEGLRFNTAISAMMILSNHLASLGCPPKAAVSRLVQCLAPFAPHLGEELWVALGFEPGVSSSDWPEFDPALCEDADIEMAVQVNGRVRGRITIPKQASQDIVEAKALQDAGVQRSVGDRAVKKVIYVPGKILNLILG